jgi:hypothetical protein
MESGASGKMQFPLSRSLSAMGTVFGDFREKALFATKTAELKSSLAMRLSSGLTNRIN